MNPAMAGYQVLKDSLDLFATEVDIGDGLSIIGRRFPLSPELNRANVPRGDCFACQRALVGDSESDEEWSDDLFIATIRHPYL